MELLSKCGYRCDLCAAYSGNQAHPGDKEELSRLWKKYYALDIPPEGIVCDGCHCDRKNAARLDSGCPVRACVDSLTIGHCGQCDKYPCDTFLQREGLTAKQAEENLGTGFSKAEFDSYLEAFDNRTHLEKYLKR